MFYLLARLLLLALVVALLPGACDGIPMPAAPTPTSLQDERSQTPALRISLDSWPDVIDPQKSSYGSEVAHLDLIYEGLTRYNEKLETVPGSAASWQYNDNATELTFQLRPGLCYSDGSLLNALRFEYAILRNIDPATAGNYASITDEIVGAAAWRSADPTAAGYNASAYRLEVGVKALDDSGQPCRDYDQVDCLDLKISLTRPAPYFHTILGLWLAFPAKEENIQAGGDRWWDDPRYQIGNGPFVMHSLEDHGGSYFTPNPHYWRGQAQVSIQFIYNANADEALRAYQKDQLDIIPVAGEQLSIIWQDAELKAQYLRYTGACTTVLKFGLGPGSPFADANGGLPLRKAFVYAFNADAWVQVLDHGLSMPTWTWIPQGIPGYNAISPLKFDPAGARAALAEWGGVERWQSLDPSQTTLAYISGSTNQERYTWLVQNYKENLGIEIGLNPVDSDAYAALVKDPATFPLLARQGWCGDYPDPQNWLSVYWRSDTPRARYQGYQNARFDELTRQADVAFEPARRFALYDLAQDQLLNDFPAAFGSNSTHNFLVKPWVKGILTNSHDTEWPGSFAALNVSIDAGLRSQAK